MEGHDKDEVDNPAMEGHGDLPSLDELVDALKAFESVDRDIGRLLRERPDLEYLRPYFSILDQLGSVGESSPSSGISDLRAQLLDKAARWQIDHPSSEQAP